MSETRKLLSRVKAVWRRQQRLHLTAGLLEFCRWVLPLFVVAVIADWKLHLPAWARGIVLLVVLGISLCKAFKAGWRHVRPFNATRTALRIEEQKGGMESLLVTALQLADTEQRHGTSDALCDLTCRKAEESAGEVKPRQ